MEIIDTCSFGRIVVLDGKIQSSEADEFIYHEALVHPAMIIHPEPRDVLICGGGEGATTREVVKHPSIRSVTMVDIDGEFVDICKQYLRKWHKGSFDDERVELICGDALTYVNKTSRKFDVVIADISDPDAEGPAAELYSRKFYSLIRERLRVGGVFVTHATEISYRPQKNISLRIFRKLEEIFPRTGLFCEYIPSFGSLWAFAIGSSRYDARKFSTDVIEERLKERNLESLMYYDAETHGRLFHLPKRIRGLMKE